MQDGKPDSDTRDREGRTCLELQEQHKLEFARNTGKIAAMVAELHQLAQRQHELVGLKHVGEDGKYSDEYWEMVESIVNELSDRKVKEYCDDWWVDVEILDYIDIAINCEEIVPDEQ